MSLLPASNNGDPTMATTPKHSVSVAGIVVRDDNRVLVIRRDDNGQWEAPGGVLELDESFEDGVRREVLEETGLQVAVERLNRFAIQALGLLKGPIDHVA